MHQLLPTKTQNDDLNNIIKIAVMAVGGQGGGVLTNWIESLARAEGYSCQATSVAGVAQRTGSTIYYIEMAPHSDRSPIFSLAPSEGDVDVVIAAEMMEVGRAILRGFVTPDRTVLIGSTHRALAVSEKMVPGDGIASAEQVRAAAEIASQRLILADLEEVAVSQGSVISSSLFGALAGSGVLPFSYIAFEDAIRRGGKGAEESLRGFAAGVEEAQRPTVKNIAINAPSKKSNITGPKSLMAKWNKLQDRLASLPGPLQPIADAGLVKVVDFQDPDYGAIYLDKLGEIRSKDCPEKKWRLTQTAAKHIANAMAYDDIIRVADLKTRSTRNKRIQTEMIVRDDTILQLTEFFHPRAEEIVSLMPAKMAARWEVSPWRMALLRRLFGKGHRLRTDKLLVFALLNFLGGLKSYRLKTRRHVIEMSHMEVWLATSLRYVDQDYDLAVELLNNRRLIKGYSDTHVRGHSKFDKVMASAVLLRGREDASVWMRRLRDAALQDEEGIALDGAIATIKSFAHP